MSDSRQHRGRLGEAAAERYLKTLGHTVIERRFRCREGEIDLITRHAQTLVFVEVKTRSVASPIAPHHSVTVAKRRVLARVGLRYLQLRGALDQPTRFDVIAVGAQGDQIRSLHHYPDAFRPE